MLPAGQDPVLVNFDLQVSAFLSVGGEFTAVIESLGFEERELLYRSFVSRFRYEF